MQGALILGIIEGVTEFLPISSTAHLLLVAKLLNLPTSEYWKFFEVFIQAGAILAVVAAFSKSLFNTKLWPKLLVSFLPTAVIGLLLHKIIKNYFFENYLLIAGSLIFISLIFLLIEYLLKNNQLKLTKKLEQLNYREAFLLGLAQSLAVVPGVSRSGIVLVGGLALGFKREETALYSFILAVPTILAASVLDLIKTDQNILFQDWLLSLVGFTTAFIFAYLSIRWFVKFLQKNNLIPFAFYRIFLGIIILFFLFW
jgi:undecaprenyl-diphosphatase